MELLLKSFRHLFNLEKNNNYYHKPRPQCITWLCRTVGNICNMFAEYCSSNICSACMFLFVVFSIWTFRIEFVYFLEVVRRKRWNWNLYYFVTIDELVWSANKLKVVLRFHFLFCVLYNMFAFEVGWDCSCNSNLSIFGVILLASSYNFLLPTFWN